MLSKRRNQRIHSPKSQKLKQTESTCDNYISSLPEFMLIVYIVKCRRCAETTGSKLSKLSVFVVLLCYLIVNVTGSRLIDLN